MSTDSAPGGRPPELDDRAWLERRYRQDGDMSIALDLHVSRGTVIRARKRLGIASQPPGRRRGSTTVPTRHLRLTQSAGDLIADLIEVERTLEVPATLEFLLERVGAVLRAHYAGERRAEMEALLGVASVAGLCHDHMQRLEAS